MEIRTPDQLETPWKYRLSIAVGGDNGRWENDETLCVKALKGNRYLVDCVNRIVWTLLV